MHNQITDTLIAITFLKSLVVKKQSFEDAATIRDYEVGYINKLKKEDKYFIDKEGSSKAIDYIPDLYKMDYNFGYCIRNDLINFLTANQCKIILSISKSLNIQNTVNEELSTLIDRIREAKIDDILM